MPANYGEGRDLLSSNSDNKPQTKSQQNLFRRMWTFTLSKVYWGFFFGPWTWMFTILSWVIPKKSKLYIFGSNEGKYFSDNSRALFEFIKKNEESIQAIWFTQSHEVFNEIEERFPGSAVISPSLKASLIYLRADQAIISYGFQDLCRMPWIPSIKINQLWHGVPLKKIGLLKSEQRTFDDYGPTWRIFMRWIDKVDRFFVASNYEMEAHEKAFKIPKNRFIISGNPRNDKLYSFEESNKAVNKKRTIIYVPTFRNRKEDDHDQESILMHPEITEKGMHEFLLRNDAELIVRPHWVSSDSDFTSDRIRSITHDEEPDLNELMIKSDVLVTDYSSAFIDWLILDRPVIFTPYDLEAYTDNFGLLDDYEKLVPSPICIEPQLIFEELDNALQNPQLYEAERNNARLRYLGDINGNICARIVMEMKR
ncbi:MAG: CDP-glycerol glycerophosphotransferase family protein [Euryarchaeota archaeon]